MRGPFRQIPDDQRLDLGERAITGSLLVFEFLTGGL